MLQATPVYLANPISKDIKKNLKMFRKNHLLSRWGRAGPANTTPLHCICFHWPTALPFLLGWRWCPEEMPPSCSLRKPSTRVRKQMSQGVWVQLDILEPPHSTSRSISKLHCTPGKSHATNQGQISVIAMKYTYQHKYDASLAMNNTSQLTDMRGQGQCHRATWF